MNENIPWLLLNFIHIRKVSSILGYIYVYNIVFCIFFKKYRIKLDPIKPPPPVIRIACILNYYSFLNRYLIVLKVKKRALVLHLKTIIKKHNFLLLLLFQYLLVENLKEH